MIGFGAIDLKVLKSRWIALIGFDGATTRKHVVDHIKLNANSKITEKDIYLHQSKDIYFAKIRCPDNTKAQELVRTLNLSTLNGAKVIAEMEYPIEGRTLKVLLGNLDDNVTEQDIADHLQKYGKI